MPILNLWFSQKYTKRIASTPTGMRIPEFGILAEYFLLFDAINAMVVIVYEAESKHGWQTLFRVNVRDAIQNT